MNPIKRNKQFVVYNLVLAMVMLKAGTSKIKITPEPGSNLCGYVSRFSPAKDVYNDLYAKSLVIDDGKNKIAIVTSDLIGLQPEFVAQIRKEVTKKTGILAKNIMISCSHIHSGPITAPLLYMGEMDNSYISDLKQKIVKVIVDANASLEPVKIGVGKGDARINKNRRDAKNGALDTEVGVVRVDKLSNEPLAVLFNYACHPVVMGSKNLSICSDYPGGAQKVIEDSTTANALFINGACGDINPINALNTDCKVADEVGKILAEEVLKVNTQIVTVSTATLVVKQKVIKLPFQKPKIEDIAQKLETNSQKLSALESGNATPLQKKLAWVECDWAEKTLTKLKQNKFPESINFEIQVIRIGDILLVGLPAEVFVEIGLNIKKNSGYENTFVIGYANGDIGYLPTKKAFAEGGYEALGAPMYYGLPVFQNTVEQNVTEAAINLIKSFTR